MFSDIYDIDFFNQSMSEHFGGRNIMVAAATIRNENLKKKVRYDKFCLWEHSGKSLSHLRRHKVIYSNSMMIHVLKSLKLRKEFNAIVDNHLNAPIAVQFRIETDWVKYSKRKKVGTNETLLIDP